VKVKVTLTLEDKAWEALRIRAIREKRSASDIIDELIAAYLKRKGGK
jgi:predicted CopG family antitoxin